MNEDQLDALIGCQAEYGGELVRVIDWIPEGPSLVLASVDSNAGIQTDQFGEARRRAPRSFTEPVYDPASGALNPLVNALTGG